MTQFASKTPRDLVSHPDDSEFERDMSDAEWRDAGLPWIVQHNEPNPILVEFRKWWSKVPDAWTLDRFIDALTLDERAPEAIRKIVREGTHRQRVHAYKVLIRLSSLAGKAALEG